MVNAFFLSYRMWTHFFVDGAHIHGLRHRPRVGRVDSFCTKCVVIISALSRMHLRRALRAFHRVFKFIVQIRIRRPCFSRASSFLLLATEVELLTLAVFEEVFAFTFKSFSEFLNTLLLLLLLVFVVLICCVCRFSCERVVRLFPCAESGTFSLFATSMEAAISNADERFTPLDAFAAA